MKYEVRERARALRAAVERMMINCSTLNHEVMSLGDVIGSCHPAYYALNRAWLQLDTASDALAKTAGEKGGD